MTQPEFLFLQTLVEIVRKLPHTNIASLVFALVSAAVLIVVKELSARYRHKLPFPIPIEIIVVSSFWFSPRAPFGVTFANASRLSSAGSVGHGYLRTSAPS